MLDRKVLLRYFLFQLPGIGIVGGMLGIALAFQAVGLTTALVLLSLWILKDLALFPLTWKAYQPSPPTGHPALISRTGQTITLLNPDGKIRLGPEIWNARSASGSTIAAHQTIRVVHVEGLRMIVEPANDSKSKTSLNH